MSRVCKFGILAAVLCFAAAVILWATSDAPTTASAFAQQSTADRPVWVGVHVEVPNQEEPDYLIGTIPQETFSAVELNSYSRKFLRISDLRIERAADEEGENVYHLECEDEYDWGIILVRHEDIISMELKKGDPLQVAGAYSR